MTVTPLGYIAVVVGLVIAVSSSKWAYRLFVCSIPFSGTVIANVGQAGNASGFQVWMLFGVLWLTSAWVRNDRFINPSINRKLGLPSIALMLFVLMAALSLFIPLLFGGQIQIESPLLFDNTTTPLGLSLGNLTALLYLIFGATVALAVGHLNLDGSILKETERLYFGVAVFVSIWGIFQFLCYLAGVHYPAAIFNNSAIYHRDGLSVFAQGADPSRVYSVATEPSILSQFLLTAVPLALPSLLGVGAVFSKRKDRIFALLLVLAMLLSRSTTALFGLLIGGAFAVYALRSLKFKRAGKVILRIVLAGCITILAAAVAYLESSGFRQLFNSMVLSKSSSYSGLERWKTVADAFGYFLQQPLFGLGWGSVTSHDLVVKLLANVGVIGSIPFWVLVTVLIERAYRQRPDYPLGDRLKAYAWAISFSLLIATNVISEFAYVFGHFWFIMGVAAAVGAGQMKVVPNLPVTKRGAVV